MKKKISLLIICILLCFQLVGCGSKESISAETFVNSLKDMGYAVTYVSDQYSSYPQIKTAIVAQKEGYQVEFYILDNEANAQSMFNTNKEIFRNSTGNVSGEFSTSISNYATYTLQSNNRYMYLSRIDNTLFYADVDKKYADAVINVTNAILY